MISSASFRLNKRPKANSTCCNARCIVGGASVAAPGIAGLVSDASIAKDTLPVLLTLPLFVVGFFVGVFKISTAASSTQHFGGGSRFAADNWTCWCGALLLHKRFLLGGPEALCSLATNLSTQAIAALADIHFAHTLEPIPVIRLPATRIVCASVGVNDLFLFKPRMPDGRHTLHSCHGAFLSVN